METLKINFRCPEDLVQKLDEEAEDDHRDRTSMIVKILTDHYDNKPQTKKKKAGR